MGLEREIRRKQQLEDMKLNGMRSRCRKCKSEMVCKPGYGWLCPVCGWVPKKQREATQWE